MITQLLFLIQKSIAKALNFPEFNFTFIHTLSALSKEAPQSFSPVYYFCI